MEFNKIYQGDSLELLEKLDDECIDMIMTSPPYWALRDYGVKGQIGLEPTLKEYLNRLLEVTAELRRVLKPTGVLFWNHGDNYCAINKHFQAKVLAYEQGKQFPTYREYPPKSLYLQNYRFIIRMIDEQGWMLRNTIVWHKPNHLPSSVKDRFANAYDHVFMLTKNRQYWFDLDAVRVPCVSQGRNGKANTFNYRVRDKVKKGRQCPQFKASSQELEQYKNYLAGKNGNRKRKSKNPGDIWSIPIQPFPEAHFATFPEKLCVRPIMAACPKDGIVLDPFAGAGTTCLVAMKLNRDYLGFEINPDYVKLARKRIVQAKKYMELEKSHGDGNV